MVTVKKLHTYTGHKDSVYTLEAGKEPHIFYSSGADGQVIEWDLNNFDSGRLVAKVPASVYALHFVKERNLLVVGQNNEGIHLINVDTLSEMGSLKLSNAAIFDIKVKDHLMVVATGNGELFIVDIDTLQIIKKTSISEKNLRTILFTSNEKCLIGTSEGQIIQIDLDSLEVEMEVMAHENSVFTLVQQADGFILSGSRDARLKYWKHKSLELEESINAHMYAINHISFQPSGKHFASASMDKTIKVWDYEKRKLLKVIDKSRHEGHSTSVNKLLWTAYNDYLISCSDDRSIGVWNLDISK